MLLRVHSAMLLAILIAATTLPANAQGFNPEEVRQIKNAQANLPNIGRAYGMRITVGATTNDGFEKPLVDSDPNLKHWCWVPVTNFKQAYIHTGERQGSYYGPKDNTPAPTKRPRSVYVKPIKEPLPYIDRSWSTPVTVAKSSRSSSDVSAKVSYVKPQVARTYEGAQQTYSYGDVSGRLRTPRYNTAFSDAKDCYGKIVSRTQTH